MYYRTIRETILFFEFVKIILNSNRKLFVRNIEKIKYFYLIKTKVLAFKLRTKIQMFSNTHG